MRDDIIQWRDGRSRFIHINLDGIRLRFTFSDFHFSLQKTQEWEWKWTPAKGIQSNQAATFKSFPAQVLLLETWEENGCKVLRYLRCVPYKVGRKLNDWQQNWGKGQNVPKVSLAYLLGGSHRVPHKGRGSHRGRGQKVMWPSNLSLKWMQSPDARIEALDLPSFADEKSLKEWFSWQCQEMCFLGDNRTRSRIEESDLILFYSALVELFSVTCRQLASSNWDTNQIQDPWSDLPAKIIKFLDI